MKKYITAGYNLYSFDTEKLTVDIVADPVSCIDYTYIAPEDGSILIGDGTEVEVKKGDLIFKMYGLWNKELQKREKPTYFVVSKDHDLAKYFATVKERENERKLRDFCKDCDSTHVEKADNA